MALFAAFILAPIVFTLAVVAWSRLFTLRSSWLRVSATILIFAAVFVVSPSMAFWVEFHIEENVADTVFWNAFN